MAALECCCRQIEVQFMMSRVRVLERFLDPFFRKLKYLSSSRLLNLVHHIVLGSLERRVLRRPVDIIFPFLNHFSVLAIFLADLVEQLTLLVVFVLAFCNPEKVSYILM